MDYYKDLDPSNFSHPKDYMLELVKRGLDAGFDLEDIAQHYKEQIQQEASTIMKQAEQDKLKLQIQNDFDNVAVIDRTNIIVFPLELVGRVYERTDKNKYFDEILEKRLERRRKVNKLRESVLHTQPRPNPRKHAYHSHS